MCSWNAVYWRSSWSQSPWRKYVYVLQYSTGVPFALPWKFSWLRPHPLFVHSCICKASRWHQFHANAGSCHFLWYSLSSPSHTHMHRQRQCWVRSQVNHNYIRLKVIISSQVKIVFCCAYNAASQCLSWNVTIFKKKKHCSWDQNFKITWKIKYSNA